MRIHADPDPQPWKTKVVHLDVGTRSGQVQLWLGTGHGGWNGNNKKVHVQGRCKGLNMEEVENHSKNTCCTYLTGQKIYTPGTYFNKMTVIK